MTDLQAKYQRLASEYSKLRAQIPVLKKAVLDEQENQNKVKDVLKEKEQVIRKYEQEIDSLSFRNQQLSKRVLFLQEELESAEVNKKKNKKAHEDHPQEPKVYIGASAVFGEELKSKIEENARLHKQVQETDQEYRSKLSVLEETLSKLEKESAQHQEVLNATVQNNKTQTDKLQEDKAMLEVRLQSLEQEMKESNSRAQNAEKQLSMISGDLQHRLDDANHIINSKLPFIDTKLKQLNALNLPTHDRKHQLRVKELVSQSANLLKELVQGLSNFFTYSEQRSKIYPTDSASEPLSPVNFKYCQYLHENAGYLRPVEQSLREFMETLREDSLTTLETAIELQPFGAHFKSLIDYMNRLLPYQLLSIDEECVLSSCPSTLEAKNRELYSSLKKLNAIFNKVGTYISIITIQSKGDINHSHPPSSHSPIFKQLCLGLHDLHDAVKEVYKHYNSKVSLEHQLPTATQKLKTTDECIVSSLVSLVTSTGKFSAFMSGNQDFFVEPAGYRTRGSSVVDGGGNDINKSNPIVASFRHQSANYIDSLSRPTPETVPHKVALQNRRILLSSAESRESLAGQITTFHEKVNKLEQEKEHWMLELQLLQIKYEKEMQKVKGLTKNLEQAQNASAAGSIQDNLDSSQSQSSINVTMTTPSLQTSMLGKLELEISSSDIDTREQLIKNHFAGRVNELTSQLQCADSKAVNFLAEVKALHKRLKIAERAKDSAQEELRTAMQNIAQLKDELQTTTRSYEGQLSMMSEHLAGMNEKLAQQKDQIDELKLQLSSAKGGKKSKK